MTRGARRSLSRGYLRFLPSGIRRDLGGGGGGGTRWAGLGATRAGVIDGGVTRIGGGSGALGFGAAREDGGGGGSARFWAVDRRTIGRDRVIVSSMSRRADGGLGGMRVVG